MTYTCFNQKFDNGVNEMLFSLTPNSIKCVTQNMSWTFAKFSHPADLETYHSSWKLAVELQ